MESRTLRKVPEKFWNDVRKDPDRWKRRVKNTELRTIRKVPERSKMDAKNVPVRAKIRVTHVMYNRREGFRKFLEGSMKVSG